MILDDLPLLRQELTLAIRDGIVAGLAEAKSLRTERDADLRCLRALLRGCLPSLSGHLRDRVQQTLGGE